MQSNLLLALFSLFRLSYKVKRGFSPSWASLVRIQRWNKEISQKNSAASTQDSGPECTIYQVFLLPVPTCPAHGIRLSKEYHREVHIQRKDHPSLSMGIAPNLLSQRFQDPYEREIIERRAQLATPVSFRYIHAQNQEQ